MHNFSELRKIPLAEIWSNEASDFTPWLESNIQTLGDAIGMDLEVTGREASVGDFSLDLLAQDLGSSKTVVIENQFKRTDHDHLGKLLTYASGFDASTVIWIAEEVRDEHRQALEWLNQRTDTETQFFAVAVEVLQIDDSKPALDFKLVVSPNEWRKSKKQKTSTNPSSRGEKYKSYFQVLIDELRENHEFTGAKTSIAQNWYNFSSGFGGIGYGAWFAKGDKVLTYVIIRQKDDENRIKIFNMLENQKRDIESKFGSTLEWTRDAERSASRIAIYRDGGIELSDSELEEIREWHIKNLLKFKEVFTPELKQTLETLA